MFQFLMRYKTGILSIGFLVLFSITVSYATPPNSPYPAGATLDPSCAPGGSNCTVASSSPWTVSSNNLYYMAGKVGIGTTTPTAPLSIQAAASISPLVLFTDGTGAELMRIASDHNTNVFMGYRAGASNTAIDHTNGWQNTFLGSEAGALNTTGYANTFVGYNAGESNTTGIVNTFVGYQSGFRNQTGLGNVDVGTDSGFRNVADNNMYIGYHGGFNAGFATNITGTQNVMIGNEIGLSQTTAANSTFVGYRAGFSIVDGVDNTAVGNLASFSITSGIENVSVGEEAGKSNSAGNSSTYVGYRAGYSATSSTSTAIGAFSLFSPVTGNSNTAAGYASGQNTVGSNNVLIGYRAGFSAGSSNVMLGYQSGANEVGNSKLYIANSNTSTPLIYGDFSAGFVGINGKLGFSNTQPTAMLQLLAGTAIASTAPLKFTSGTNLTTPENGAMEYDGSHIYFTTGGTRYQLDQQPTGTPLPSQTSNAGKFLTTDGTNLSWAAIAGSGGGTVTSITAGTGLGGGTITVSGTLTNNLSTGVSGGQSVIGGTGAGDNLTLTSTSNATKGFIYLGTGAGYDGTNIRFGVGLQAPVTTLEALSATEQLRLAYDATHFASFTTASTGALTIANNGNLLTLSGNSVAISGALTAGASSSNFYLPGGSSATATNAAQFQFAGSTNVNLRTAFYGATSTVLGVGNSYSNVVVASAPITAAASGTHAALANMVINPLGTVTNASAVPITNTASLYINGASSAGTNNYALYVPSGSDYFGGNVGIANAAPSTLLYVGSGSVSTNTVVATFQNATGTCSVNPTTNGGITCSSDMTLKKNITNLSDDSSWSFNTNITANNRSVLSRLLALNPVNYNWNPELDTDAKHAGFIAQEVQQIFPDLVSQDPATHLLSLNYSGLVPYTIEAVKEMNLNIASLDDPAKTNSWRDAIMKWLADSKNGITDFFSKKVTTDQLCVKDANGETCLTRSQIDQMLKNGNGQQGAGSAPITVPVTGSDPTAPPAAPDSSQTPEAAAPAIVTDPAATQTPVVDSPSATVL